MSKKFMLLFFLLKVSMAIAYGIIQQYYYGYGDTFEYFNAANRVYELLPEHPDYYFRLTFLPAKKPFPEEMLSVLDGEKIKFYAHPRNYMFVRVNSLLHLFSFGNYYVHSVFFAFLSFVGILQIIRFFANFFPEKTNWFKWLICFFPSIIYWGSGVHKDAMIILGLGAILFCIRKLFKQKWVFIIPFIISCFLTYLSRNYTFLILLPALTALILSHYYPKKGVLKFAIIYLIGIIFFFNAGKIHPSLDYPQKFVDVQEVFLSLKGKSNFEIQGLEPDLKGFVQLVPTSMKSIFLRPSINDIKKPIYALAFVDNYLMLILFLGALLFGNYKRWGTAQLNVFLFSLTFSISFLLIIGMVVSNLGALVRYEITGSIFLVGAAVMFLDLEKVHKRFPRLGKI